MNKDLKQKLFGMTLIAALCLSIFPIRLNAFDGGSNGGGPTQHVPQVQASVRVEIGSDEGSRESCQGGTSDEAKAAMDLATKKAKAKCALQGYDGDLVFTLHSSTQTQAMDTQVITNGLEENSVYFCQASVDLGCSKKTATVNAVQP